MGEVHANYARLDEVALVEEHYRTDVHASAPQFTQLLDRVHLGA